MIISDSNDCIYEAQKAAKTRRSDNKANRATIISRKVKNAPELKSVNEYIQLVKRTQRDEILLEFRRSVEVATETHRSKLRSLLAEERDRFYVEFWKVEIINIIRVVKYEYDEYFSV